LPGIQAFPSSAGVAGAAWGVHRDGPQHSPASATLTLLNRMCRELQWLVQFYVNRREHILWHPPRAPRHESPESPGPSSADRSATGLTTHCTTSSASWTGARRHLFQHHGSVRNMTGRRAARMSPVSRGLGPLGLLGVCEKYLHAFRFIGLAPWARNTNLR